MSKFQAFTEKTFSTGEMSRWSGFSRQTIINMSNSSELDAKTIKRGSCTAREFDLEQHYRLMQTVKKPKILRQIQAFCNLKGGVGKTTLSVQSAMWAVLKGYRVLFVDADPQAHASLSFGLDIESHQATLGEIILGECSLEEATISLTPFLDVIPSNLNLSALDPEISQMPARDTRVQSVLKPHLDRYDLIIFDTNPSHSVLNTNIFIAAHQNNLIVQTAALSMYGLTTFFRIYQDLEKWFDLAHSQTRIIPNLHRTGEKRAALALGTLHTQYSDMTTSAVVHQSTEYQAALAARGSVLDMKGIAAKDIEKLSTELFL